jgi:protein phosphatase
MTALTYRYVAHTDVGLRRSKNEDSGYASRRLLAIADGMGGAAAGDLASSSAMEVLREADRDLQGDALDALKDVVGRANARLGELIRADPAVEGMGTTIEAMLWDGEKLAVAHLGDSRTYRLRANTLTQLSTDHTFVQSLVDEGKLTVEEARVHPHRSLLLRAMLGRDDNDADFSWIQPSAGDRYLLCSDGLSDMVADRLIEQALQSDSIDLAATELVRLALEGGGHDNVTVVIAEFSPADAEPATEVVSDDGQPQLVGAAAEQRRPRTGRSAAATDAAPGAASETVTDGDLDEEELRYAPREPGGRPWVRRTVLTALLVAIVAAAAFGGYRWTQTQYYVAESEGRVAIYRGVQADVPGVTLHHVDQVSQIDLDTLPQYSRSQVEAGIEAQSRADAQAIVENLDQFVTPTPTPTPSEPTTTPTASDA